MSFKRKDTGLQAALLELVEANPEDMILRGCARTYIVMKQSLGLTVDPRNTASYANAIYHYERITGATWSGNP